MNVKCSICGKDCFDTCFNMDYYYKGQFIEREVCYNCYSDYLLLEGSIFGEIHNGDILSRQ